MQNLLREPEEFFKRIVLYSSVHEYTRDRSFTRDFQVFHQGHFLRGGREEEENLWEYWDSKVGSQKREKIIQN